MRPACPVSFAVSSVRFAFVLLDRRRFLISGSRSSNAKYVAGVLAYQGDVLSLVLSSTPSPRASGSFNTVPCGPRHYLCSASRRGGSAIMRSQIFPNPVLRPILDNVPTDTKDVYRTRRGNALFGKELELRNIFT